MTRIEQIKTFIKALANHLNIEFVRSEQSGERPSYPFMSYKTLSGNPEPAQCIAEKYAADKTDDTRIVKTSQRDSNLVISLGFIGSEKDYNSLWAFAEEAHDWIDSIPGLDKANEIGISVSAAGPIQDRTVALETEYEHRVGLDIKITAGESKTEVVDAVDLSATIGSIMKD